MIAPGWLDDKLHDDDDDDQFNVLQLDENLRMSGRYFMIYRDAARRNFNVNFEKPAGRKIVSWAVGMLRGPQHPRYWPTDPDFHLLKYVEPARGLPYACICDAEFWSLDFENLPPLFMESSFFSAKSTCRRSLLVQAYRENALRSSEMTGRRGETGFSSRSISRKRRNLFIIMTRALRSIWR